MSWLAAWAISGGGFARPGVGMLFFYIGVFAPSFVAVWLTARREGRARVDALLRRLIQWRVGLRWYLFALTYIAAIKLAGALIHHLAAGDLSAASDRRRFIGLTATRVQSPSPVI